MDSVAEEEKKRDESVSVMGNESSKLDVTKDPSGGTKEEQFHRVLVEPEYSILQPTGIQYPDVRRLTVTGPKTTEEKRDPSEDRKTPGDIDSGETLCNGELLSTKDYTDEDLIEASRKIVESSIAEAVKIVASENDTGESKSSETIGLSLVDESEVHAAKEKDNINKVQVGDTDFLKKTITEFVENREEDSTEVCLSAVSDHTNATTEHDQNVSAEGVDKVKDNVTDKKAKASTKAEKKSKKNKAKEQYLREREIIDSVKEFIKEEEKKSKDKKETKRGISFPSMFKFSKRKPKPESDIAQSSDNGVGEDNVNVRPDKDSELSDGNVSNSNINASPSRSDAQGAKGSQPGVRRLNSLDSGIVMDKYCDTANGVEYSVVNKTKNTNVASAENDQIKEADIVTSENVKKSIAEPIYVNGEKADEDFVYINEKAIDVTSTDREPQNATESEEKVEDKNESVNDSSETQDAETKVKKVDQIRRNEKFKLKKKSWSFQIGGNKKSNTESDAVVSMDPNVSQKDPAGQKKSKWRLGKFSFRKADDLSASTPDLNKQSVISKSKSSIDSEVSESPEHLSDKKKGTKLKKIKAKKDKKIKTKETMGKTDGDIGVRSSSMIDIPVVDNKPRSRRSIVEDEVSYTQTDAFEGVAISDLSQDEDDVHVSLNPSGPETRKASEEKRATEREILDDKVDESKSSFDNSGDVYVNITKRNAEITEEPKLSDSLPSKYIYAGDDEYAQIVKTDNSKNSDVDQGEKTEISVKSDILDAVNAAGEIETNRNMEATLSVIQEVDNIEKAEKMTDTSVIEEDKITVKTDSGLECKAAQDSLVQLYVKEEHDIHINDEKERDNQSSEHAYSNMIYSAESFEAELKEFKEAEKLKEQDNDSDAYVQLKELTDDNRDSDTVATPPSPIASALENINVNQDEQMDVSASDLKEETVKLVSPTVVSRASIKLSVHPKVLIMKEAGVQAPDIHMPLDKEYDFGVVRGKPNVASIGVQVSDGHQNEVEKSREVDDTATKTPTAYF